MATEVGSRDWYTQSMTSLKTARASYMDHWMQCQMYTAPRSGRFVTTDVNRGDRRYKMIINNIALQALEVAVAGMLAGGLPETRPWEKLRMHDDELNDYKPVKVWLAKLERFVRAVLNSGNFYDEAQPFIRQLLQFGTCAQWQEDDFDHVSWFQTFPTGSFVIANDDKGRVSQFGREFQWQAEAMLRRFGRENVSEPVRRAYDDGNYNAWFDVSMFVHSNPFADSRKMLNKYKKVRVCYWQPGEDKLSGKFLSEAGVDFFPVNVGRWSREAEDVYATSWPVANALGDISGLQIKEKEKAKGLKKMVSPPLGAPSSMKSAQVNSLSNSVTLYDQGVNKQKIEKLYDVNLPMGELRVDIAADEKRIKDALYNNLFLAISDIEGIQPRNQYDLSKRDQERLLQLAPVVGRLGRDFASNVVRRILLQGQRAGLPIFANPPPEVKGKAVMVDYVSPLAMAQNAVVTGPIQATMTFIAGLGEAGFQDAYDYGNVGEAITRFNDAQGAPPEIINSIDEVAQRQAQRARQQNEERALAAAQSIATTAKTAADAKTGGEDNALTDLVKGE